MTEAAIALCGVLAGIIGMLVRGKFANGRSDGKPNAQAGSMDIEWWMNYFEKMEGRIVAAIKQRRQRDPER